MKNKLYLCEIGDIYDNQIRLPYSTGLVWSYCKTFKEITDNYELLDWLFWREDINQMLSRIKNPDIVGFSHFVWNEQINNDLAKKVKNKYPNCLIIYGGQSTPKQDRCKDFFKIHPYVDVLIHGEGEITFKKLLDGYLNNDIDSVSGCTFKQENNISKTNLSRPRIQDISIMPSPYLDGTFDNLAKKSPYKLDVIIETARGCPYSCTFCEWGDNYYTLLKRQPIEKLKKEIDWSVEHKVEFLYNADNNFGLFPEHKYITEYIVNKKKKTGYPHIMRNDWAKGRADKVMPIAKMLHDAGLQKGVTVALQSMNKETLKAIKRKNIDNGKLKEFVKLYNQEDVPYFLEFILGLPGETVDSFIDGATEIMELGLHTFVTYNPMIVLPNTPFNEKSYQEKYGIKLKEVSQPFAHFEIENVEEYHEKTSIVRSHNGMNEDEYVEAWMYRWLFNFGHYFGYLQFISRFMRSVYDIEYYDFYTDIMDYIKNKKDGFLKKEYDVTKNGIEEVFENKSLWGRVLNDVKKNFYWEYEEATAIHISLNHKLFYDEIYKYLIDKYELEDNLVKCLIDYQIVRIQHPNQEYPFTTKLDYNIHEVLLGNTKIVKNGGHVLKVHGKKYDDVYDWAKKCFWWGKRAQLFQTKVEAVNE